MHETTWSDWLSREVFHSDKSSPFCHFPVVEIPYRPELRLACVEPSVRLWTILRLCRPFATVRLWVGPVSYTELCLICGGSWYLVIGWSEEVSRGHHGSPAPANRPGDRAAGTFCEKSVDDTCLGSRTSYQQRRLYIQKRSPAGKLESAHEVLVVGEINDRQRALRLVTEEGVGAPSLPRSAPASEICL